jgi:small subunit ribosomal protein S17
MAKTLTGIVSSDKADKTIVVTVHTRKTHPLYRKQYSVSKKFMAHDEQNEARVGDKVEITETRPQSARKRFALSKIVDKPALREDTLAVTKSDDTGAKKPLRSKTDDAESEEA